MDKPTAAPADKASMETAAKSLGLTWTDERYHVLARTVRGTTRLTRVNNAIIFGRSAHPLGGDPVVSEIYPLTPDGLRLAHARFAEAADEAAIDAPAFIKMTRTAYEGFQALADDLDMSPSQLVTAIGHALKDVPGGLLETSIREWMAALADVMAGIPPEEGE